MDLYRAIDIQAITDKLDTIVNTAIDKKGETLFPKTKDLIKAKKIIMDYIKQKRRVIYGGTAYHRLIKNKNSKDGVYDEREEVTKDVEFYSPEPVIDMINICNILTKDFEYVSGREAMHHETFSIFVQFQGLCDISYMPKNIFFNMPKECINGMYYSHPSFILVDILRQYNDPLTSYWRLKDKTFDRANILLKYYPLQLESKAPEFPSSHSINGYVFDIIKNIPSLIHLGSIAYSYYIDTKEKTIDITKPLVCMTSNLKEDAVNIYNAISKAHKVTVEEYIPFFQFWDRRVVFLHKGYPVLTLLGNNKICVPYHTVTYNGDKFKAIQLGGVYKDLQHGGEDAQGPNTFKMGTFILTFMYLLIEQHYYTINKNQQRAEHVRRMMYQLLKARREYLTEKNITVVDKSPYQEFILECHGNTADPIVSSRVRALSRKKKGLPIALIYDPAFDDPEAEKYKLNFDNTSGNIITNPKRLYILQPETTDTTETTSSESP